MSISDKKLYEDTIKEVCSFGAGHAAASLSRMINKKVTIHVPKIWVRLPEEPLIFPDQGKEAIIALDSHFGPDKRGVIFHLLSLEDSKRLVSSLLGEQIDEISGISKDALLEIGNILSGSIVGSLANFIGDKIQIGQPNITIDHPLAIIDYAIGEQMKACNMALFTSVDMSIGGEKIQLMQLFFPFFDIVGLIWGKMSDLMGAKSEEFFL